MKVLNFKISVVLIISLLLSLNLANAKPAAKNKAKPVSANTTQTNNAPLTQQTFEEKMISVQFRYVGTALHEISIKNRAKSDILVEMLDRKYVLHPNESIVVPRPNRQLLTLHYGFFFPTQTIPDSILHHRFDKTLIFQLPEHSKAIQIKNNKKQ